VDGDTDSSDLEHAPLNRAGTPSVRRTTYAMSLFQSMETKAKIITLFAFQLAFNST